MLKINKSKNSLKKEGRRVRKLPQKKNRKRIIKD
jgi:hypothetical protein